MPRMDELIDQPWEGQVYQNVGSTKTMPLVYFLLASCYHVLTYCAIKKKEGTVKVAI